MTQNNNLPLTVDQKSSAESVENHEESTLLSCIICGRDITDLCVYAQKKHVAEHFNDINRILPVHNDSNGARIYTYHNMNFSDYTKYGKCVVLAGLLNSELPRGMVVGINDITAISRVRSSLMSTIMAADPNNLTSVVGNRHEIIRIAALLFRDENWLNILCCRLVADL